MATSAAAAKPQESQQPEQLAAEVAALTQEVHRLKAQFRKLQHDMADVADLTLREHLERQGFVKSSAMLVQHHRRRFTTALARHPMTFRPRDQMLPSMLGKPEFISMLRFMGKGSLQALGAVSTTLSHGVEQVAGIAYSHLYICGGYSGGKGVSDVARFDIAHGIWEPLPPLNKARFDSAAAVVSGRLYVVGGIDKMVTSGSAERFSPATKVWESLHPMLSTPRAGHCAVSLGRLLLVCGGMNASRRRLATTEQWNEATEKMDASTPEMQTARTAAMAAVVSGQVFVLGGLDSNMQTISTVERLDVTSKSWVFGPSLLLPRNSAVVTVVGDKLYICGGMVGKKYLASIECFDPFTGDREVLPDMVQPRASAACAVFANKLYIFGGYGPFEDQTLSPLSSAEFFDLDGKRWHTSSPLPMPRCGAASAVCG